MGIHSSVAIASLIAETRMNEAQSFLADAKLAFPETKGIPGALPVTGLGWSTARSLRMYVDLVTLWGFGDFDDTLGCSSYYDRNSPWYNGFFGGYAMRSRKPDGTPWGYRADGTADFAEFFEVCAVDYNFITAGSFGCPPEKMCFRVTDYETYKKGDWDVVDVVAMVPSGLHQPTQFQVDPESYLVFGIPHPGLVNGSSFEEVELRGQFYMRRWPTLSQGHPVSLSWGAAYHNTNAGTQLLAKTMELMAPQYLRLGT